MEKKCFIISPIGEPDSPERKHADEVLNFIIKPALEELKDNKVCNITALRADEIEERGKITDQIYKEINKGDLCIVDCSFLKPNVLYELAVALCAVKPVIILAINGTELPFDIKDLRTIFFDLDITSYQNRTYIKQLTSAIRSFESSNWKIESSIPGFSTTISEEDEDIRFFGTVHDFGTDPDWQKIVNDSEELLYLMGTALDGWRSTYTEGENFGEILVKKAKEGCKIKILIMDPENPYLKQIHNVKLINIFPEEVQATIKRNIEFYSEYVDQSENFEFRLIRNGRLTQNQAINDKYGIYIPHFYSIKDNQWPIWKLKRGTSHYDDLLKEFYGLWNINAPEIKEVKRVIEKPPIDFDKEVKKAVEGISIFLSYATKDYESFKIKEIVTNLSRFPEIKNVYYWQENMTDNIILYMESTLKRCDVLLLFCSPNAFKSAAVENEWMASISLKKPIIPVFFNPKHIPVLLMTNLGVKLDAFDIQKSIKEIYDLILRLVEK